MTLTKAEKTTLLNRLTELRTRLTGDMFNDMAIKEEMHAIEMQLNNVRPDNGYFECEGCGS